MLYLENKFNMFLCVCGLLVLTINHAAMRTAVSFTHIITKCSWDFQGKKEEKNREERIERRKNKEERIKEKGIKNKEKE
jgi:hypothetical protein